MSGPIMDYKATLIVNEQSIEVHTIVSRELKNISYNLNAAREIDPPTVALVLYLMSKDICGKIGMEIEELIDGFYDETGTLQ